jgi:DNA polymerase (family 10)
MNNQRIAQRFIQIADQLEQSGANPYRIRAYRRASRSLTGLKTDVAQLAGEGALEGIPGVGADLAAKIRVFLKTGEIPDPAPDDISLIFSDPEHSTPFKDLTDAGYLDRRLARVIHRRFFIQTPEDLERLVRSRLLRTLPHFSREAEQKIIRGLEFLAGRESA